MKHVRVNVAGIQEEMPLRSVYPEHGGRALRRAKFHIHAVASALVVVPTPNDPHIE